MSLEYFIQDNFRTKFMKSNIWIEKGWGEVVDYATFKDIDTAIEEIINQDEEHGAFWIGNLENEYVLEVHKNLDLFFVYGENQNEQLQINLNNWEDVKKIFEFYFENEFEKLKNELEMRQHTYKKIS